MQLAYTVLGIFCFTICVFLFVIAVLVWAKPSDWKTGSLRALLVLAIAGCIGWGGISSFKQARVFPTDILIVGNGR
jgi:hypothetical protein